MAEALKLGRKIPMRCSQGQGNKDQQLEWADCAPEKPSSRLQAVIQIFDSLLSLPLQTEAQTQAAVSHTEAGCSGEQIQEGRREVEGKSFTELISERMLKTHPEAFHKPSSGNHLRTNPGNSSQKFILDAPLRHQSPRHSSQISIPEIHLEHSSRKFIPDIHLGSSSQSSVSDTHLGH